MDKFETTPADTSAAYVPASGNSLDDPLVLQELCTLIWRIDRSAQAQALDLDPDNAAQLSRRINELYSFLQGRGILVRDQVGKPFLAGMALNVLAYIPDEKCKSEGCELILETLKPTVLRGGVVVAPGEVIVGTPGEAVSSMSAEDSVFHALMPGTP